MVCQPPNTFSIREADPNYCPAWRAIGRAFDVCLDGNVVSKVISYDCACGWVRRLKTDERGNLIIAADREHVEEELLTGSVTVRWIAHVDA